MNKRLRWVFGSVLGVILVLVSSSLIVKASGPATNTISLYASYGNHSLKRPTGLLVSGSRLIIADTGNNRIAALNGSTFVVLAGSGTAGLQNGAPSAAEFHLPTALSGPGVITTFRQGASGPNAFWEFKVVDSANHVIRSVCIPFQPLTGSSPILCGAPGQVSTLAGNGTSGLVDGTGTSAELGTGGGVDVQTTSTTQSYFTDISNNALRVLSSSGTLSTVASSVPGFVNGPLSSARFEFPASVTSDQSGNYIVADTGNYAIRRIDSAANVSTLAGNGVQGYVDGTSEEAEFGLPIQVLYNSADGYTYVSDAQNNCIRRIDAAGNVSTYAGAHTAGLVDGSLTVARFSHPSGMALDVSRQVLYIADTYNDAIRQIDMSAGEVTTLVH